MKIGAYWSLSGVALLIASSLSTPVFAHGGGLNSEGCHNDRKNGGYHCHRAPAPEPQTFYSEPSGSSGSFRNCKAARAAGAAPVRIGDPGYGAHLDRDGDGIGCE
jgi:hypothetical protein